MNWRRKANSPAKETMGLEGRPFLDGQLVKAGQDAG